MKTDDQVTQKAKLAFIRQDYFSRLKIEVQKLKENPFLANAEYLDITFNCPRGDAQEIMFAMGSPQSL